MKQVSNYERQCEDWRQRFLSMDQAAIMRKLPEIHVEGEYLTLRHDGRKLGIHRENGQIKALEDGGSVSINTRLNVYTLMWYCKEEARRANEWLPFARLKDAGPFGPAFQRSIIDVFAATFSGKSQVLAQTLTDMGGLRLPVGDVGYQLNAFECIPVRFHFWDADDEFPAQANLLFEISATDFIHVESLVTIASEGLCRISECSQIPLKRPTF